MRFQLVDPSYCVTTDLTYHKHAIYEGVRSLYPNVSINVHRYYFEIEDESSQIVSDLPLINEEIAARDPYLKSLFKNHPVKTDNEIIFSPLLFKNAYSLTTHINSKRACSSMTLKFQSF